MQSLTLLGGTLGAGKTTLLANLLKNNSFGKSDGIIVMDAAGNIDYSRIRKLAEEKGVRIENATSACTVCDGPESAFNKLKEMEGLENILIELSGQMPLSTMTSRLSSKGVETPNSIYLVDPRKFALAQAADEIPFAQVVGTTKSDGEINLSKYNTQAKEVRIKEHGPYTLNGLFEGARAPKLVELTTTNKHKHTSEKGMVSKWSHKIHNPYHDTDSLDQMLGTLSTSYDRIKGYVALNKNSVYSFDGVNGEFKSSVFEDTELGNGTILVANNGDNYFPETQVAKRTQRLTAKPEVTPVIRRGSERETFERYIEHAKSAKQYDDILGAGEQYEFETKNSDLLHSNLPYVAQGKLELIESGDLSRSQRVRQGMSILYYLTENPEIATQTKQKLSRIYVRDYDAMTTSDWNEIDNASEPQETRTYIELIRNKL